LIRKYLAERWWTAGERRAKSERETSERRARDERKAREKRAVGESAEERLAKRRPAGCAALNIDWGMAGLLSKTKKPAGMAGFFVFPTISSVYQIGGVKPPNMMRRKWLVITTSYFG
jgi:hypothetical protein